MEVEVRDGGVEEVVEAAKAARLAGDEVGDLAVARGVQRGRVDGVQKIAGGGDVELELREGCLSVGEAGRFQAGKAGDRRLGEIGGEQDLTAQRIHVGREAAVEQARRLDPVVAGMVRRLAEDDGELCQPARKDGKGDV